MKQNAVRSNGMEGSEISALHEKEQDTTSESLSSQSRDIKNNRIKEGLLVYPKLPEYTASLTSLLGLILVTELTRGGAA